MKKLQEMQQIQTLLNMTDSAQVQQNQILQMPQQLNAPPVLPQINMSTFPTHLRIPPTAPQKPPVPNDYAAVHDQEKEVATERHKPY